MASLVTRRLAIVTGAGFAATMKQTCRLGLVCKWPLSGHDNKQFECPLVLSRSFCQNSPDCGILQLYRNVWRYSLGTLINIVVPVVGTI